MRPSPEVADAIDASRIRTWLESHHEQMVDDLRDYVSHESPSGDKSCLRVALSWLQSFIAERLGTPDSVQLTDGGDHGDVLRLGFDGVGDQRLLILCHYDTVWDRGTVQEWPFVLREDTASGPGVFDMKAGLIQAVWALRAMKALGLARPPISLLLNGDEEVGSPASRPVIEESCAQSAACLVFEASADGALKTARAGWGRYEVEIEGVEAHAGLDPENGASAIDELARVVLSLRALSDDAAGTHTNVGLVSGGTRGNVVAGHARADVDVRVRTASEARRVETAIAAQRASDPRVSLRITGGWNRPVMVRSAEMGSLFDLAKTLARQLGVELEEVAVGGASDGNLVAAQGVPVIDGLGAVGGGAHARHEYVSVGAMAERAALAAALMHAFALDRG